MKNLSIGIALIFLYLGCFSVSAEKAEAAETGRNPFDWEMRMSYDGLTERTGEEAAAERKTAQKKAHWSLILENNMGIYAYDEDSLSFEQNPDGTINREQVNTIVKTVFTDEELLKKLNKKYRSSLKKNEKTQYCELLMLFNVQNHTYRVKEMKVFGSEGSVLETKTGNAGFVPVPEHTFAEAMQEICIRAVQNTEAEKDGETETVEMRGR